MTDIKKTGQANEDKKKEALQARLVGLAFALVFCGLLGYIFIVKVF